jgi:glycosyltransferase involved in cell wall biosynthesis
MSLEGRRTVNIGWPHTSSPRLQDREPPWFTIVHPFYNEPKRLELQLENWRAYKDQFKDNLEIIIADDCSDPGVHAMLEWEEIDFNLTVYRVLQDLKWNTPGALNLGISQSKTHWVLIMDSDCLLKPEAMQELIDLRPDEKFFYVFDRDRITDDPIKKSNTRFLPCSILFNRPTFDEVYGFDEDYQGGGYAYFDNDFWDKMLLAGRWIGKLPRDRLVITEYMEDVVGPNIQQKTGVTKENYVVNKHLFYDKKAGRKGRSEDMLRFPWEKSFEHRRNP